LIAGDLDVIDEVVDVSRFVSRRAAPFRLRGSTKFHRLFEGVQMRVSVEDTTAPVEIAGIAGSLRSASWARSLLRAAANRQPVNVRVTVWDGLDAVPLFNEDAEDPVPAGVAEMRQLIEKSDALLIATPEYNRAIPGVLKNALDWASRPYGASVLTDKPVAVVGTSPLPSGAASALSDVQGVLSILRAEVVEADLAIGQVHTRIDAEGRISDPELAARITELLVKLAQSAKPGRSEPADPELETVDAESRLLEVSA
jgi:chromate reductase